MTVTPEGFLVCRHVPIARTGDQEYLPRELGVDGEGLIKVFRPPDEVFSEATLASFEGKPVSLGHPPRGINVTNSSAYIKGHAQNVRRGEGDEADLMIADLVIYDQELIRQISNGLREVSCGYDYDLDLEGEAPVQRNIRGNHIAVVETGRAGDRVSIRDEKPSMRKFRYKEGSYMMETRNKKKAGLVKRILGIAATDTSPTEIAEVIEAVEDAIAPDESPALPMPKSDNQPPAPAAPALDNEAIGKMLSEMKDSLSKLTDEIAALKTQGDQDPLDTLLTEVSGKASDEGGESVEEKTEDEEAPKASNEESETVEDESLLTTKVGAAETPENPIPGTDAAARNALAAAIKGIKPIIAKLPEKERRAAADEAAKALRSAFGKSQVGKKPINAYAQLNADRAAAARKQAHDAQANANDDGRKLGREIMKERNPHYMGQG